MKQGAWTAERVAMRLIALTDAHGAPNRFQLHEIVGDSGRVAVLAVSRIARLEWAAVNRHLEGTKLKATYEVRKGPDKPAYVAISAG